MEPLYSPPGTLTAHQVATLLGITLGGVRLLVHRRQLARIGGSPRQALYALKDVQALDSKRRTRSAA
ncbi:hypothetical protein [Streptomyces sp. NBC_00306]|uniref:hypothetical protein n=1 Tax=Streptomyces sp. NBC_00306 TaxID=2975708 RepID=UPI002E29190D|nr:hypothetical protein [Streptomyces sp. NBC_00306]